MNKEKSKYTINFEFIESELIGLGKKYKQTVHEMASLKRSPEELQSTMLGYSKRIDWLNRLLDALEEIYADVNGITKEIINLLYKEGKTFDYIVNNYDLSRKRILRQHYLIVDEVMEKLGIIYDKIKYKNSDRYIPIEVKRAVFTRDNGKCTKCDTEEKLHYHHIHRFSDGGLNTVDNLVLLCVGCHAEEHKNEKSYRMLKAMVRG